MAHFHPLSIGGWFSNLAGLFIRVNTCAAGDATGDRS
jgi:hypothetical protein